MRIQRFAAGCLAVAGIVVLAGVGWALLAAGALLYIATPGPSLGRIWRQGVVDARRAWRWMVAGGRRSVAIVSMPAAVLLLAVGIGASVGIGWGVVAGGSALAAVSLLAGQNA